MKIRNLIPGLILLMALTGGRAASPAKPASSSTGSASASVRGVVKLEGTVPKGKPISMAADPSSAKLHSAPVFSQDIVAGANRGLQNVVIFVADGLADRTYDPPTEPAVIEQKGCMYQPHVIAMHANQKLEVINREPTTHNIHPIPANNREWNKAELPGAKVEDTFAREEIAIPVKCNVHPWMKSYIAVFQHPYFATTGKDGSFDLNNLPPGTYTLKAWHEKLGTATQQITVGTSETKTVEFTFKSKTGS
jgi:plastocyanin